MKKAVVILYILFVLQSAIIVFAFTILIAGAPKYLSGAFEGYTEALVKRLDVRYVLKSNL